MAHKFYQSVLYQMGVSAGRKVGLYEDGDFVFSYPEDMVMLQHEPELARLAEEMEEPFHFLGFTFFGASVHNPAEFLIFVEGEDDAAVRYAEMISVAISSMNQLHNDRYDRSNLIRNIILDNVLPGDILVSAKELHLAYDTPRVIMLLRMADGSASAHTLSEVVQSIFPEKNRDFVFNLDERNTILAKDIQPGTTDAELDQLAKTILDTVTAEAYTQITIGIGSIAPTIKDLAKSYKDARVALEVGKVFDTEHKIINYENLGIGRLIYQLPTTLCELFLSEVFKKESIDVLDSETLFTIQKFFENDLNVSETSRQLYVHRNTLVYRLDKVQKLTGLDLRIFDHAIVFKIAMMVKRYLVSNPMKL
ncbi:MAG: PucR family transcriptional regulator [Ruminococcaceae bacterium]|nr:PucR family transcriptional regulator [Oscillospiraceae bacterium]